MKPVPRPSDEGVGRPTRMRDRRAPLIPDQGLDRRGDSTHSCARIGGMILAMVVASPVRGHVNKHAS